MKSLNHDFAFHSFIALHTTWVKPIILYHHP
uniref:Uncharacterized protein n=1 Tax=Arundo donax TaxID=35708 RepID=A0A0A9ADG7_ARUDO